MSSVLICERLAGLARSGYPVRGALIELPARLGHESPQVIAAARRARLGAPIGDCVSPLATIFGDALPQLRACLEGSATSGANWAVGVEELAGSIREKATLRRSAEVAGAGATLSARIIAALPLLMLPMGLRQLTDGIVAVSIAFGVLIGIAGYRWLVRVIPTPPVDDPSATVADEVAASLDAGWPLDAALEHAVVNRPPFRSAFRRVQLGRPWRRAIAEDLPGLAAALTDAHATGAPVAATLRRTAASIRRDARQEFERQVERAPVKMVLPLVTCCLPSFVLIAIVPLLRGLAQPV
ncbi:MAG: type II secretion system F family protein [Actinobacteria bacterium]|nr:type II secretion system F family protein [Actinomycetota bacterium]